MFHEIERYLIDAYLILAIRVPYAEVHMVEHDDKMENYLIEHIEKITEKANRLRSEQILTHECNWCNDNDNQQKKRIANFDGSLFIKTQEVVKMTIDALEKELNQPKVL
jgi:hypothetical protein